MRDFKQLHVWQRAQALSTAIHEAGRRFPRRDHITLKSQLTRAVDSIATNIVEGCGAATQREFARYLDISIKSANETEHHLLAAEVRGALPASDAQSLCAEVVEIRKMVYVLRKRVLSAALSER
jgi:four helix bundle protein